MPTRSRPSTLLPLLLAAALAAFGEPRIQEDAEPRGFDPCAAQLAQACAAHARGELGSALELLRAACEETPGEPEIRLWLARTLTDLGRAAEAQAVLEPALETAPHSAWLLAELGRAQRSLGESLRAEETLLRALELYPGCGAARASLVALLLDAGRAQEAQAALAPLAIDAPELSLVSLLRARVARALGRADEAEALLRAHLEADPTDADLRLALCRELLEAGRPAQAFEVGEPLLEGAREPLTLRILARAAEGAGRPLDALACLAAALTTHPSEPGVLADLGELLEHTDLRRPLAQRWIDAQPGEAEAWRELLEVHLDAGRLADFFAELETVPPDMRGHVRVRLLEGEALRRADRRAEARSVLEELCATDGGERAQYELGLLEYAEGHDAAAAEAFALGAADRWAADAHYNRGICLERLGRFAEAAGSYERATELRPEFREAWFQLGTACRYRLGEAQRARSAYARYLELGGDDPEVRRWMEEQR